MTHQAVSVQGEKIRTSDGVDLYVEIGGEGPPCLYLHGGPGSGAYWMRKFSGAMLERHFRMVYLDQRGVCRSTSPEDGNYGMARMVQDFEEVRAALEIEQWLTLGHSFGGILQVGYALRHPQVIQGMILLNCGLHVAESAAAALPKACEFLNDLDVVACSNEGLPVFTRLMGAYAELRRRDLFWKMGYASLEAKLVMDRTFDEIPDWNKGQENELAMDDYMADFKPLTRGLSMPVLYFYGKSDWMIGPESHRGVAFPNMLLWGSEVGHVASLENPEDLARAIDHYCGTFGF